MGEVRDQRSFTDRVLNYLGFKPDLNVPSPPSRPLSPEEAAVAHYQAHGNDTVDLSSPANVRQFIVNTPQIDSYQSTIKDDHRCGAAALLNASLLDGNNKANANALYLTAQKQGVTISPEQSQALDDWGKGKLNPKQGALLQELMYDTADSTDGKRSNNPGGLSEGEVAMAVYNLQKNGGLPNTTELTITNRNVAQSSSEDGQDKKFSNHYTAHTTTTTQGTVSADSYPDANGTAQVKVGQGAPSAVNNDLFSGQIHGTPASQGPVEMTNAVDGSGHYTYGDKQAMGRGDSTAALVTQKVGGNGEQEFRDPKTGLPLSPEAAQETKKLMESAAEELNNSAQGSSGGQGQVSAQPGETPAGVTAQTGQPANPIPAPSSTTVNYHKNTGVKVAPLQTDATGTVASKEVRAEKDGYSKQVGYQSKNVQAQAGVKIGEVAAYAGASSNVDLKNLKINAEVHAGVEANVVDAQASARVKLGNIGDLGGDARARVGADALGQAGVGFDPKNGTIDVGASGEAFTGARANAGVNLNLGPVGAHAGVAVQAGVGIEAGVDVGLKDGKFHFGLDIGFSLGIGIRFNLGFTIDFKAIGKGIVDGIKAIGKGFKKLGKAMAKGAKKMKKAAKKAAKWMGKTAKKAAKKMKNLAKKAGKKVKNLAKHAGKKVKNVAKKAGKKLKKLFGRHKKKHHKAGHKHKADKPHKAEARKNSEHGKPKDTHKVAPAHHHMAALKKALHQHESKFDQVA